MRALSVKLFTCERGAFAGTAKALRIKTLHRLHTYRLFAGGSNCAPAARPRHKCDGRPFERAKAVCIRRADLM